MKYSLGQSVVKLGTDYTAGRTGEVVEIQENETFQQTRIRVRWMKEKNGTPTGGCKDLKNGLRTWCKPNTIKAI